MTLYPSIDRALRVSRRSIEDCCPTLVGKALLDAGAARLGVHARRVAHLTQVAGLIDHTLLKPEASREPNIETALPRSSRVPVSPPCASILRGGPSVRRPAACRLFLVGVCSVVGFPLGATTSDVKQFRDPTGDFRGRAARWTW